MPRERLSPVWMLFPGAGSGDLPFARTTAAASWRCSCAGCRSTDAAVPSYPRRDAWTSVKPSSASLS